MLIKKKQKQKNPLALKDKAIVKKCVPNSKALNFIKQTLLCIKKQITCRYNVWVASALQPYQQINHPDKIFTNEPVS